MLSPSMIVSTTPRKPRTDAMDSLLQSLFRSGTSYARMKAILTSFRGARLRKNILPSIAVHANVQAFEIVGGNRNRLLLHGVTRTTERRGL